MKKLLTLATAGILLTVTLAGCTDSPTKPTHNTTSATTTISSTLTPTPDTSAAPAASASPTPAATTSPTTATSQDYYFSSNKSLTTDPHLYLTQSGAKRVPIADSKPVSSGSCKIIGSVTTFPGKETTSSAAARESVSDSILEGFFNSYPTDAGRIKKTVRVESTTPHVQVEQRQVNFTSKATKTNGYVAARYFNGGKAYIYAVICLNQTTLPAGASVVVQP